MLPAKPLIGTRVAHPKIAKLMFLMVLFSYGNTQFKHQSAGERYLITTGKNS